VNRRGFISGLLAAGTVAIAAEFKVTEAVAEEMLEELTKDQDRIFVSGPKTEFLAQPDKIFTSTANIREFYANECAKALGRDVDNQIMRVVRRMQDAIDTDLAEIGSDAKIIVEMPRIELTGPLSNPKRSFNLVAGVRPEKSFLGTDILKVGFLDGAPRSDEARGILDHTGREIA
jgi:hypothetical protein